MEKVKETSLYSDNVSWKEVDKKYLELIKEKSTTEEIKPAYEFLLNSIGDKHAVIRSPKDFSTIAYYTGPTGPDHRDSKFLYEVINDVSAEFTYKLLLQKIGYLKVVRANAPKHIEIL
ncbi:MAG: hypothetical protein ACJA01_003214 [Saprospiraceae bacterium]